MLRKKKKYIRPRKLFDKARIDEERELIKTYGLKNKKEIWKAEAAIKKFRSRAKKLITASEEEQAVLFEKLNKMGFKVEKTADVLDLKKENWLKRRLQSILIIKNLAKPREARQLITHRHVIVNGEIVNIPSYMISIDEEDKIQVFKRIKKKEEDGKSEVKEQEKQEKVQEEIKSEEKENGE